MFDMYLTYGFTYENKLGSVYLCIKPYKTSTPIGRAGRHTQRSLETPTSFNFRHTVYAQRR